MAGKTMIYKNRDWIVRRTRRDGVTMQCAIRAGYGYTLDHDFITLKDWNGDWFHAPVHMAGKVWVDVSVFLDAWRVAIGIAALNVDAACYPAAITCTRWREAAPMDSTSALAAGFEALHPRPLTAAELATIAVQMAALAHRLRIEEAARRLEAKP